MLSCPRLFCVLTAKQTLVTSITKFSPRFHLSSSTTINTLSSPPQPSPRLFCTQQTISPPQQEQHNPTPPTPDLFGFITGDCKVIEIAHSFWHQIVHKGDTVVDATCGNGHDTLALFNMVSNTHNPHDDNARGCVYAFDIQECAIESTTALLNSSFPQNANAKIMDTVKLFQVCHTKMEDVLPKNTFVKLVVFNLGYLPGGDKSLVTIPEKTLEALKAATRVVGSGGVVSVMLYVGHPGGRQEYETVLAFVSALPVDTWVCSKFEMLNRPLAPVLVFIFKK